MAQTIENKIRRGFLNAVSVGFRPMKWEPNTETGGLTFTSHELLETSVVPVPANPSALLQRSAATHRVEALADRMSKSARKATLGQRMAMHEIWRMTRT